MRQQLVAATMVFAGTVFAGTVAHTEQAPAGARVPSNLAEFEKMFQEVSNWGRWGKDDQLGAANLVNAAKRRAAAALVKAGESVSLAHNLVTEKAADTPNPFQMTNRGNTYGSTFHSTTHSHIDALCHLAHQGKTYNGYPFSEVHTDRCVKMGIQHLKNGVVTRGILIDIPLLKGVPYLEPGTPVYPEDIEAWEKKAGVKIGAGDAIFLRTGRWLRREKLGPWQLYPAPPGEPGYHASVVPWLKRRDVAFVGADVSNDVVPSQVDGVALPFHTLTIVALGIYLFDAMDLEAAAATAAKLKRWEFMLVGGPLAVDGGTGSPINLTAIF